MSERLSDFDRTKRKNAANDRRRSSWKGPPTAEPNPPSVDPGIVGTGGLGRRRVGDWAGRIPPAGLGQWTGGFFAASPYN